MSSSGNGNESSKKEPPAASRPGKSGTIFADSGGGMHLSVSKSKKRKSRSEDDVNEVAAVPTQTRFIERVKKRRGGSAAEIATRPGSSRRATATTTTTEPPQAGSVATGTEDNLSGFFDPKQWTIMGEAHQMVEALVKDKNGGPCRKKVLALAKYGIEKTKIRGVDNSRFTPSGLVDEAWATVRYTWADPSNDLVLLEDDPCAYTTMGGGSNQPGFPLVGISSSFMENDYPVGHPDSPATRDAYTMDDKKTLLLFFRKMKHEFLHVVHRFLAIKHKASFPAQKYTPEKYTPHKPPPRRRVAQPQVGDHDEEEDSAGPILPLFFNQKLSSNNNPLCLYYDNKYLKLSDEHVEGLLKLELYSIQVKDCPHNTMKFSVEHCRAIKAKVFDEDFTDGVSIAANHAATRAVSRSSSTSDSRASSPAKGLETDDSTDDADKQPAWRRYGSIPIQVRFPLRFPELISLTSNNQTTNVETS